MIAMSQTCFFVLAAAFIFLAIGLSAMWGWPGLFVSIGLVLLVLSAVAFVEIAVRQL
jgi:hypothetical protein